LENDEGYNESDNASDSNVKDEICRLFIVTILMNDNE